MPPPVASSRNEPPPPLDTAQRPLSKPGSLSVEQATSPGFTDLYPAHFHGQNLELHGVRAGTNVLVHRANPTQRLEEIDYTNNDASLRIRLTWKGGAPLVETLRTGPDSTTC